MIEKERRALLHGDAPPEDTGKLVVTGRLVIAGAGQGEVAGGAETLFGHGEPPATDLAGTGGEEVEHPRPEANRRRHRLR